MGTSLLLQMLLRGMGQENEKVYFQQLDAPNQVRKSRKIFPSRYHIMQRPPDHNTANLCDRPNCKCPSQHVSREGLKLCDSCGDARHPTVHKNKKMPYEQSMVLREPQTEYHYNSNYRQTPAINKQEPVYYYNGWALPTQKCFIGNLEKQAPSNVLSKPVNTEQLKISNKGPMTPASPKAPSLPKEESRSQIKMQKIDYPPKFETRKPLPINLEQVDINNRMQNLFLIP